MTTQSALMLIIFLVCSLSSIDWCLKGQYTDAIAFACFGLGDLALAWEFRGGGSFGG